MSTTQGGDTWAYTYDQANRLIKATHNGTVIGTYGYDADGMRVKKTENGETTTYLTVGPRAIKSLWRLPGATAPGFIPRSSGPVN